MHGQQDWAYGAPFDHLTSCCLDYEHHAQPRPLRMLLARYIDPPRFDANAPPGPVDEQVDLAPFLGLWDVGKPRAACNHVG